MLTSLLQFLLQLDTYTVLFALAISAFASVKPEYVSSSAAKMSFFRDIFFCLSYYVSNIWCFFTFN